jgi:DnaJ family protein A protein 2
MATYYDVLRVHRQATLVTIKSAYRDMALTHHPDKGGDPEMFKRVDEAYKTLSDSNKRRTYDYRTLSVSDLFDTRYAEPFYTSDPLNSILPVVVSLHEACAGCPINVCFVRTCVNEQQLLSCPHCNGTGISFLAQRLCGSKPLDTQCLYCTDGYVTESISTYKRDEHVVCMLPIGCPEGMLFKFTGKGHQMPGTAPGDLIVRILYGDMGTYHVPIDTLDLVHTMCITLHESLSGFLRLLMHPNGHTIRIYSASVTQPGTYTVTGQGIHFVSQGQCGHMYVHVQVMYPDRINTQASTLSTILGQDGRNHLPMAGDILLDRQHVWPPTDFGDLLKHLNSHEYGNHL